MNSRNDWLEDLQRNISELIAKSPAADIERNVRSMMTQTFSRLDLVTREEFDIQKELLERLFERVAALEHRIQALEGLDGAPDNGGAPAAGGAGDAAADVTTSPDAGAGPAVADNAGSDAGSRPEPGAGAPRPAGKKQGAKPES